MPEPTRFQLIQTQSRNLKWLENYGKYLIQFHGIEPLTCLNYELVQILNGLWLEWFLKEPEVEELKVDIMESLGEFGPEDNNGVVLKVG